MKIPFEPIIWGTTINIHLVLEYLAFFIAYRYYILLRKKNIDVISSKNRLTILIGAAIGALLGSRIMGFLENPIIDFTTENLIQLLNVKTIMGGLFGGLIGVEITKWMVNEKQSSGDLFTLPIIVGIFIGRVGCFLSGTNEFTYGKVTTFFTGMDLGDGLLRHPTALYELLFLIPLFFILKKIRLQNKLENGNLFIIFMVSYFSFRFFLEFLKPTNFIIFGLSSIQYLCILCVLYYQKPIIKLLRNAY